MEQITNVIVSHGDNLSKIAKAHFTSVDQIMDLNPSIKNKNLIITGDTLKIPVTIFDKKDNKLTNLDIEKELNDTIPKDMKLTQANDSIANKENLISQSKDKNDTGINLLKYGSILVGTVIAGLALTKKGKLGQAQKLAQKNVNSPMYPTPKAKETTQIVKNMLNGDKVDYKKLIDKSISRKPTKRQHESTLKRLHKAFNIMTPTKKAETIIASIEKVFQKPTNYKKVCENYIPQMPQNHKATHQELKKVFKNT